MTPDELEALLDDAYRAAEFTVTEYQGTIDKLIQTIRDQQAEIERLREEHAYWKQRAAECTESHQKVNAELEHLEATRSYTELDLLEENQKLLAERDQLRAENERYKRDHELHGDIIDKCDAAADILAQYLGRPYPFGTVWAEAAYELPELVDKIVAENARLKGLNGNLFGSVVKLTDNNAQLLELLREVEWQKSYNSGVEAWRCLYCLQYYSRYIQKHEREHSPSCELAQVLRHAPASEAAESNLEPMTVGESPLSSRLDGSERRAHVDASDTSPERVDDAGQNRQNNGEPDRHDAVLQCLADLLRRVETEIEHGDARWYPDHACAVCVPHSDILIEGFLCARHRAHELLKLFPDRSDARSGDGAAYETGMTAPSDSGQSVAAGSASNQSGIRDQLQVPDWAVCRHCFRKATTYAGNDLKVQYVCAECEHKANSGIRDQCVCVFYSCIFGNTTECGYCGRTLGTKGEP